MSGYHLTEESKECPRCGTWMEPGYLAPAGELRVNWVGPKTGILRRKIAKLDVYRCPSCGFIHLESKPDSNDR